MNKNAKRLLSLVLCLMMVLSVLPLAALAADTITVYCQAPSSWSKCNAYWWGSTGENPGWPGKAMTQNSEGIWYIEIPADTPNIIFNNGSAQSKDLVVPEDDKKMFVYSENIWDVYGKKDVVEYDYYIAGTGALCGSDWNPSDVANGMTDADGDGIYTKTYEAVAAGTYEFKVTDGTWDNSWGAAGSTDNYVLTVEADNSVEIRFNTADSTITVVIGGEEVEEPTTEPTETEPFVPGVNEYALVGYINGADYGCNDDYENVGEYIFVDGTLSTSFNVDSYVFLKTTDNAYWFMTEAYCSETTGTFVTAGTEKMFVPGGVELIFTLTENVDGTLVLSYEIGNEIPTDPTEPSDPSDPSEPVETAYYVAGSFNGWNEKDETYLLTDNGDGTWSLTIPGMVADNYEMKVTDGTWTNSWGDGAGNFSFKVEADCDVTVTFNSETFEITVAGEGVNSEKDPLVINTVHVAGMAGLTGAEWDVTANAMTNNNGVYTITFTGIAAGTYEFKFAANGAWEINWASGIEMISGEIQDAWINPMGNSFIVVEQDDSTVTLTLDLTAMDAITGEGGKCCAIIEAPAIDDDFTGFKTLADGEYYFVNGVQSTATGLTKIDGVWYYLKSGRWASELNQLAKYNNEWWYLVDGKVASTTTALIDLNGEDWYVVKGKIAANTTGLVKIDGIWYYIVKGKVAGNTTDLIKYNNEWFYVVKGKVASTTTAMIKYNNEDWYVVKGKIAANTTGLVKYDGVWYYVVKGKLAGNTTSLVKYNNEWFYVVKGRVDSQTTGIVVYNNGWYYLVKGKIAAKTTTLVKYGGSWYYVKEGSVDWSYTGNFIYNGGTYKIVKGRVA